MNHLECSQGPKSSIWTYLFVIIVAYIISSILGEIPLVITLLFDTSGLPFSDIWENPQNSNISSNMILALMLIPSLILIYTLGRLIKSGHGRTLTQTINGTRKIRWQRVRTGAITCFIVMTITLIIDYIIYPDNYIFQFDLSSFIPLFFIAFLMIPFQAASEELLFRGYLAQGIGILTNSRWLVLIIPSLLFGLAHYANPEVEKYGFAVMMSQYILSALIYGLISILDDGIELAIGMHAANNIFICLATTYESSVFQTMSVFKVINIDPSYFDLITVILTEGILVFYFARKYKWNFSVLNKKIHNKPELIPSETSES